MILQLNKLRFSDHRHHHPCRMSEAGLTSLQAFRSLVSKTVNRSLESLKLGSEFLTLTWIHQCFKMVPMINNAFAKLMVEIDYPVTSWEDGSIEEYLNYNINLLDLLNLISSCISHVNQARVSLTYALSLVESSPCLGIKRIREIKSKHDDDFIMELKACGGDDAERNKNEKEWIFHEGMMVLKSIGFWVCGVVLSALKMEVDPMIYVSTDSLLMDLDSIFKKKFMEEGGIVKEVKGVNECVCLIVSSGIHDSHGRTELRKRLEVVENVLKGLKDEEEGIFASVMAARNEVIEILRRNKN